MYTPQEIRQLVLQSRISKKEAEEKERAINRAKFNELKLELMGRFPSYFEGHILPRIVEAANRGEGEFIHYVDNNLAYVELLILKWLRSQGWEVEGDFNWRDEIQPDGMSSRSVYKGYLRFKLF